MVNLTQKFGEICEEVESENDIVKVRKEIHPLINDTFIRECIDLYKHIHELNKFLQSIKPQYLLFDTDKGLDEEQRDEVDTYSRLKLKEYNSRLNHLQIYENKRVSSNQHFRFNKSVSSTINKHREGILLCLNKDLRTASKLLLDIQETRLSRSKDVDDDDLKTKLSSINVKSSKYKIIDHHDEPDLEYEQLSSEQIQILENENNEILSNKLNDLAKIEKINKNVLEIAQLESELATHLSMQSENISNLMNDYDVTNVGIIDGNKILKSVKNKKNYSIQIVIYTSIFLGMFLLFYDFIN